ncbi:amidohydrolase family protein [Sedimentitalea sp. JM2-8]|uniref:Amidohydrolase family protein n=1 Tax=Sedimentitalea xiamensis TaxID=3050037 RepID=A0ABT7FHM5_9RHOB|nr:amidohydrolase family protein [Sedimentitalea xiamensis]MDK3074644.1 amidohydrolase family protein [Sedimentitalea xiamensis]
MDIVDAHFHVWRQADLPWLTGPVQPRIFGPYEPIRRDYPMSEYLRDIAGTGVTRSVYVQANWPTEKAEDEAAWIESLIAETGWPHGLVAYADMTVPDVRPALDRMMRFPHLKGIRQQFHWHENPTYRFAPHADLCRDPAVQKNVARLADYGLVFDLQVFDDQMAGACELADACPDVTFVLQHSGMLEDVSDAGRARWRRAMTGLAERRNVVSKLSGFGTFQHRLDPGLIGWLTSETVTMFGADRCLWGSNFPIEKLWTDYAALIGAHRAAAGGLSAAERDAIFNTTAARVYRLT